MRYPQAYVLQVLNGNFQVIAQKKQLMGKLTALLPLLCRNQVFLVPQCAYLLESVWEVVNQMPWEFVLKLLPKNKKLTDLQKLITFDRNTFSAIFLSPDF